MALEKTTITLSPTASVDLMNYIFRTGGGLQQGNIILKTIEGIDEEFIIGKGIYKFIRLGEVLSFTNLAHLNHWIKLPIAWLNEVHHVQPITNEDETVTNVDVTNKEHYNTPMLENDTDCLLRITDAYFTDFFALIIGEETNIFCNQKAVDEITTNFTPVQPEII